MIMLFLTACLHRPAVTTPAAPPHATLQFAIQAHGHTVAGLMVTQVDPAQTRVEALSPAGTSLFQVRATADDVTVDAPDPAWSSAIERLPFDRDMRMLLYWRCPTGRCQTPHGRLRQRVRSDGSTVLRWRGQGGPARAVLSPGKATLRDRLRGYKIIVAGEALDVR